MGKLGFKLSITEAELLNSTYLMLIRKKVYFNKKFTHSYYSLGNPPTTLILSYSIEYLSRIIFCKCVLGAIHMSYAEDFAHFGQKEQFKIKMKLKQRKST